MDDVQQKKMENTHEEEHTKEELKVLENRGIKAWKKAQIIASMKQDQKYEKELKHITDTPLNSRKQLPADLDDQEWNLEPTNTDNTQGSSLQNDKKSD
ncbi:hypothetical protein ACROYT_G014914 [Oculina patagonica]